MSASYIRGLAAMARAFPEDQRDPALSLSHHRIAAVTETPPAWLDKAADREWSVRELQRGIRERRDRVDEEEQYRSQVERLNRRLASSTRNGRPAGTSRPC